MPKTMAVPNSDLVWAQMRYCPYWPARIVEAPPFMAPTASNKKCVLFFGSRELGFVDQEKIKSYTENREKLILKGRSRGTPFNDAVQRLEEYMTNRKKYRSNATAIIANKRIQVKTERDVEQVLGIKTEQNPTTKNHRSPNVKESREDRSKLISKIGELQKENQRLVLDLKRKDTAYAALVLEKQKTEKQSSEKVVSLSAELSNLKSELSIMKANRTTNESKSDESNENVFEVEKIIDHKEIMHFLVRWKHFSSEDDTWERESDLTCPKLLKQYKRNMNSFSS